MATGTCNGVTTLSIPPDQRFDLTAFCSPLFLLCGQLGTPGLPWNRERDQEKEQEMRRSTVWSTRQRLKVLKRDYYFTCCVARMLLGHWELVKGYYDIVG